MFLLVARHIPPLARDQKGAVERLVFLPGSFLSLLQPAAKAGRAEKKGCFPLGGEGSYPGGKAGFAVQVVEGHGRFGPDQQIGTGRLRKSFRAQIEVAAHGVPLHGRIPFDVLIDVALDQREQRQGWRVPVRRLFPSPVCRSRRSCRLFRGGEPPHAERQKQGEARCREHGRSCPELRAFPALRH